MLKPARIDGDELEMGDEIYLVGNSHIDLSWLWPRSETIHEVCPRTFQTMLDITREYPFFRFSQSAAQTYEWMEKYYPRVFDGIKSRVRDGNWEIVGGSWVEHNANMLCEESLARQYLFGKRYFMSKFGVDVKIAWLPDSFGFCWTMPQVLRKCGIDAFMTFKLKWQVERMKPPVPFPYYLFWWESADGSRVLAYHTVGSYSENLDRTNSEPNLRRQLEELKKVHGLTKLMFLFGSGDHGGGPTREMIEAGLELAERSDFPQVRFATAGQYFSSVASDTQGLPTVKDELYVKTHRGTLTTEAMMKRENRRCEVLLLSLERFSYIAKRYGFRHPKSDVSECWKKLLLNQVHDNLDGTSAECVYQDAASDYADIRRFVSEVRHLHFIAKEANTLGEGVPLVVFNVLAWERSGIAEVSMSEMRMEKRVESFHLKDKQGAEAISQLVTDDAGNQKLIFLAEDVPPLGFKVYWVTMSDQSPGSETDLKVSETALENRRLRVIVSAKPECAVKVCDKTSGKQFFDGGGGGNRLEVFEDMPLQAPDGEPAWNIYLGERSEPDAAGTAVLERGPLRGRIRAKRNLGSSTFYQDVVLYAHDTKVEFETHIDWHEHYRFCKVAFPLSFSSSWATYEIPYGIMQRYDSSLIGPPADLIENPPRLWERADMAKWECSALRFVDVTDGQEAFGVTLLNDSKHGFSFERNILRMSLLRGARRGYPSTPESWTDQSDSPRVGVHQIRYAVCPHEGGWRASGSVRKGYEFNYPLQAVFEANHPGTLPSEYSFAEVAPENIVLTAFKEAEDSEELIVRIYESWGMESEAEITLDREPRSAIQTDLMEWDKYQPKTEYKVRGKKLILHMSPWEIKTVRIQFLSSE